MTGVHEPASLVVTVVGQGDLHCVFGEGVDVEFQVFRVGLASSQDYCVVGDWSWGHLQVFLDQGWSEDLGELLMSQVDFQILGLFN